MASDLSCLQVPREESKDDFASQQEPFLLISNGEYCHIQNDYMFNNYHCYYDVGGKIPGRNIGCSFREWFLLVGSYGDRLPPVLVNRLSKETIELPLLNFKYEFWYEFCILTSLPSDPSCHIVFFNRKEHSLIIWQPGDKEFTIRRWDYQVFPDRVRALVAGKLFLEILNYELVLVMVEFKESTYRFEVVEMDRSEMLYNKRTWQHYLFEYSGELFCLCKIMCAYHSSKLADFKILKADLLNKKWVRIEKLGRLAIFIGYQTGHAHCVAAAVDSGIAANSVYFLEQDDLDSYYVYNLEEGTVRMKPVFSSMRTTRRKQLDWIMLPYDLSFSKLLKDDQESIRKKQKEMKKNGEVEEDEVQESWNMVPPELLDLIRSRLFGKDYAMFSVVCKAWHQTSSRDYSTPSLLSLETLLLEQCQSSSPLLMSQEDIITSSVPIFRFFDPVHRKLYRTIIPELREVDIHHSRDGWLLVRRPRDGSMFFLNPLTQEKIELPRMPAGVYTNDFSFSFSSPPTRSNCLVTGIMDHVICCTVYTLKHGDRTWREHRCKNNGAAGKYLHNNAVLHYFMTKNRDMVLLNSKNGAVDQFPDRRSWYLKFVGSKYHRGDDFLVEIDGGPAFVSVEPNGGRISIFKWNHLEKDWESVEGGVEFRGKVMFLSKRCSFMDDVGGMGNIIFLPMIDDAKFGVFYSLATRKYHTFYNDYSSKLPYHVDKFLDGIWVKPDRKIVGHGNLKWFEPKSAVFNCHGCWCTWF